MVSAAAHDIDHPGHNNLFEIKTKSKLATLYNDMSVLENHHAASFFFLIDEASCQIFKNFKPEDESRMRKMVIENIIGTDMTKHFGVVGDLKSFAESDEFRPAGKHKIDLFKALLHAADIGNPTRPFQTAKR